MAMRYKKKSRKVYKKAYKKRLTQKKRTVPYAGHVKRTFRWVDDNSFDISGSKTFYGTLNFMLTDCPDYALWCQLYEQYRIGKTNIRFLPPVETYEEASDVAVAGQFIGGYKPVLYCYADHDDLTLPSSLAQFWARPRTLIRPFSGRGIRYSLMPTYPGVGDGGVQYPVKSPWIDTISPDEQFMGIKYAIDQNKYSSMGQKYQYKIVYEMTVEFRGLKFSTDY